MFLVVLESVLVLLGIGVIGFLISRQDLIPENVPDFVLKDQDKSSGSLI